MVDRQGQDLNTVDLTDSQLQQVQAGRDSIAAQNSQITINKSFISWFGDRQASTGMDWDWAARVLAIQRTDIQKRLKDVLLEDQLLSIDAEERLDLVGRSPLASMRELKVKGKSDERVDPDRLMIEMFGQEEIGGKLLILGQPGAGKTTALLGLAKQLVNGAIANPKTVIPVIFELSAWKNDGQSIEDFLIEQLYDNVGGNRKSRIYETWLEQRLLLPLLDGLDELGMVRQGKCTEKLNEFARTYPQVVVCCRVREFENVGIKLNELNGSIVLQPLSDQQIQDYLVTVDRSGLWQQIVNTPEMALMLEPNEDGEPGLLRVPLFISIAAMIYDEEQSFRNKGDLLEKYIERQLSFDVRKGDRRRKEFVGRTWAFKSIEREPHRQQTEYSLSWLAGRLREINEVDLLIEQMQPSWLDSTAAKLCYRLIRGLIGGLIFGLIFGLSQWLSQWLISTLDVGLSQGLSVGLNGGLIFGLRGMLSVTLNIGLRTGLIGGLIFGLIFGLIGGMNDVEVVEGFKFSMYCVRREIIRSLNQWLSMGLIGGVIFGLIVGLITELIGNPSIGPGIGLLGGLIFGPGFGLIFGLIGGLIFGLIGGLKEELKVRSKPNQGIWNSLQSTIWITILIYCAGVILVMTGLVYEHIAMKHNWIDIPKIFSRNSLELILVGFFALFFGIFAGGGLACIQHLSLRIVLTQDKKIPWNYARFLNYCAERRLLQRIGGRYRFIHRELLDHFGMKN